MLYTVKYKKHGQKFWRTVRKVKGDSRTSFLGEHHLLLVLHDESLKLVPIPGTDFEFSRERFISIHKNAEKTAGQSIPVEQQP